MTPATRGSGACSVSTKSPIDAAGARTRRRNQQLDQFAAVLSHDLRNPLSVASGRLALARERDDPEEFDRVEEAHDG